jgi:hypothetical protein
MDVIDTIAPTKIAVVATPEAINSGHGARRRVR